MRRWHGEIEEKRLLFVLFDFFQHLVCQLIQHIFMMEIFSGGAFSPIFLAGSHGLPVRKLRKAVVFDINIGRHIQRAADSKEIVEAVCHRGILDRSAVIHTLAGIKIRKLCKLRRFGKIHSQMPFPNHGRMVALLPEKIGHRLSALLQKGLRVTAHHIGFQSGPPVIPAGQDAVSGRRTHSGGRMGIRKPQAVFAHRIKIRRRERAVLIESADITVSHIIRQNIDHVWFFVHLTFLHFLKQAPWPVTNGACFYLLFTFRNCYLHSSRSLS